MLAFVFTAILFGLLYQYKGKNGARNGFSRNIPTYDWNDSLSTALERQAYQSKTILLALVDLAAYEMTINFYETSLLKHKIQTYLFLSTNAKMCELLNAKNIYCVQYGSDSASEKQSVFGTKDFFRKMNIRTDMILDALRLGYNVLHTDVDMIFIRNPLHELPCLNGSCDVAIMWDISVYNAGFLYIKSTTVTIELYKEMKKTAETTEKSDQVALNDAIEKMRGKLKIEKLPQNKYSCGKFFYEDQGRHFGDDPSLNKAPAIVIHNNWIVSMESKTYRFKEMLQWYYDENGYYSSNTAKYISYRNPACNASYNKESEEALWSKEMNALQNALMIGALLNRSVILPKFHCGKKFCSLLKWIKIRHFDSAFKDKYRESLFLTHPKVPHEISSSLSSLRVIQIRSSELDTMYPDGAIKHYPSDEVNGPSRSEILYWYGNITESVLRFTSLFGEFKLLRKLPLGLYNTSVSAFKTAFVRGSYEQYK